MQARRKKPGMRVLEKSSETLNCFRPRSPSLGREKEGQHRAPSIPPCTGIKLPRQGSTPTAPLCLSFPTCNAFLGRALVPPRGLAAAGTPRCVRDTHCSSVRPVRFLQYMGKSSNWKV